VSQPQDKIVAHIAGDLAVIETTRLNIAPSTRLEHEQLTQLSLDHRVAATLWPATERRLLPRMDSERRTAGNFLLAIRIRDRDRLVGAIEFSGIDIAFFVEPAFWGNGFASEALQAVCARMVPDETTVQAFVMRENVASRRVLEKACFEFAGLRSGRASILRYTRVQTRKIRQAIVATSWTAAG
jgi:RimJ/RimL family protein N-acetyltransferase